MRQEIVTWYTPDEQIPEVGKLLRTISNHGWEVVGYYMEDGDFYDFEGFCIFDKNIKEWSYIKEE